MDEPESAAQSFSSPALKQDGLPEYEKNPSVNHFYLFNIQTMASYAKVKATSLMGQEVILHNQYILKSVVTYNDHTVNLHTCLWT